MARGLPWATLAAVPETCFTAWGSLFECLQLKAEDTLLVRGASCGLGYAVLQIAHALGCHVTVTTHRVRYRELLERHGANEVVLNAGEPLAGTDRTPRATKVLELAGPATLRDSLRLLEPGSVCCSSGILGGKETLDGFDPITFVPNGRYLTSFYSNCPTQETMTAIFEFVAGHRIEPLVARVFDFGDLPAAIQMQDTGGFQGKIVVANES